MHEGEIFTDFGSDIREYFSKQLALDGVDIESEVQRLKGLGLLTNEPHLVCMHWFNVQKRKIVPQPRQVVRSNTLNSRKLQPNMEKLVQKIEKLSEEGANLTPYLSDRWRSLDRKDADRLLNDWGIYHLHLKPSGGRELIYLLVFEDVLLFLDVKDHRAFSDKHFLKIIREMCPAYLERYRLKGLVGVQFDPSSKEISEARHRNMNTLVPLDGGVYAPMGGGQASSGISIESVQRADRMFAVVRKWEETIRHNKAKIFECLEEEAKTRLSELRFGLVFDGRQMKLLETTLRIPIEDDFFKYDF